MVSEYLGSHPGELSNGHSEVPLVKLMEQLSPSYSTSDLPALALGIVKFNQSIIAVTLSRNQARAAVSKRTERIATERTGLVNLVDERTAHFAFRRGTFSRIEFTIELAE